MNLIQTLEAEQITKLTDGKSIPDFAAGDTVRVNVRVVEGARERLQAYEGVCIFRTVKVLSVCSRCTHPVWTTSPLFAVVVFVARSFTTCAAARVSLLVSPRRHPVGLRS